MGIPITKPPPRRPGESARDYCERHDVIEWRRLTEEAAASNRSMITIAAALFVVALAAVARFTRSSKSRQDHE